VGDRVIKATRRTWRCVCVWDVVMLFMGTLKFGIKALHEIIVINREKKEGLGNVMLYILKERKV
jgi:hypothetical protein